MIRYLIIVISFFVSMLSIAEEPITGKLLYRLKCAQCHGLEGDGYGVNVPDMSILPRDHSDKSEMSTRTDEDLFKAIKHGGKAVSKSTLMPNWDGNLSDKEIRLIIAYLRELCCSGDEK